MALGIHLKAGIGILRWRSPYLCREAAAAAAAAPGERGGTGLRGDTAPALLHAGSAAMLLSPP